MLTPDGYLPRLIDDRLGTMLDTFGAVCVEGPKWSGKTWISLNRANSSINVSRGSIDMHQLVLMDRDYAFQGDVPHLIDEWQDIPDIWDATKVRVDGSRDAGRFILTGSSTPRIKGVGHSGAGRIGSIRIRTMSLSESGDSDGSASLRSMFDGTFTNTPLGDRPSLEHLIRLTVRGGWPYLVGREDADPVMANRDYMRKVVDDACRMDDTERDRFKMWLLIRSLARNESTITDVTKIVSDIREYEGEDVSAQTIRKYLDVLDRLFLIEDQPAFSPNVRSSARIGKNAKRHLADPSLAVAAMELTPEMLLKDLNTYGFLFEAMCERDLYIYASANGGKVSHLRDNKGREVDAVVEMPDGSWGMFEIKLGTHQVDDAASNMLRLAGAFDVPPKVMCVICGMAPCAYRRPDGVYVVPITSLGV